MPDLSSVATVKARIVVENDGVKGKLTDTSKDMQNVAKAAKDASKELAAGAADLAKGLEAVGKAAEGAAGSAPSGGGGGGGGGGGSSGGESGGGEGGGGGKGKGLKGLVAEFRSYRKEQKMQGAQAKFLAREIIELMPFLGGLKGGLQSLGGVFFEVAMGGIGLGLGIEAVKLGMEKWAEESERTHTQLNLIRESWTRLGEAQLNSLNTWEKYTRKMTEDEKVFTSAMEKTKGLSEAQADARQKLEQSGPGMMAWIKAAFGDESGFKDFNARLAQLDAVSKKIFEERKKAAEMEAALEAETKSTAEYEKARLAKAVEAEQDRQAYIAKGKVLDIQRQMIRAGQQETITLDGKLKVTELLAQREKADREGREWLVKQIDKEIKLTKAQTEEKLRKYKIDKMAAELAEKEQLAASLDKQQSDQKHDENVKFANAFGYKEANFNLEKQKAMEAIQKAQYDESELLYTLRTNDLISYEEYEEKKRRIAEKYAAQRLAIEHEHIDKVISAAERSFSTGLMSMMDTTKSTKDAFKDMATAFSNSIKQMAADMITSQLLTLLRKLAVYAFSLGVGPSPAAAEANIPAVSAPEMVGGMATGGLVVGPGGPKSDSIMARLSNGEYVMTAEAVKRYGVATLEAMNGRTGGVTTARTRYADGGLVAGPSGGSDQTPVTIINQTGQPATARKTMGQDGRELIEVIVGHIAKDIRSGGLVAQTIEGTYGAARQGVDRG